MDKKTPEERSRNMSQIHSKNTKPEILVRKMLFAMGYRFRLQRKDLPGKPDIVMPSKKIAIFVHGCFWHSHTGCKKASIPTSNRDFWVQKLQGNVERDIKVRNELLASGWRVLWVWECATKTKAAAELLPQRLLDWICSDDQFGEISSQPLNRT